MARKRVLIVEDKPEIVKLLEMNLRREGYETSSAADGQAGLARFKLLKPDLVILDVMLPKLDGIEVCKAIRAASTVPVLMLSGKGEEVDRVVGLEIGADDYMTKPFSVRELLARVKALLRRPAIQKDAPAGGGARSILAGSLEISLEAFEARVGGVPVPLTTKEFNLLRTLAEAPDRVFDREELLTLAWGSKNSAELDTRTVDQHMARLRKKLGAEGARLLTIKNRGYRFRK